MYAVAYTTPDGFGSVGWLARVDRGEVEVGDPVLGWARVPAEDCFAVLDTEEGVVLPAVEPTLQATPITEDETPGEVRLAANRDGGEIVELRSLRKKGEVFPSGYPLAWERVKRWREEVAPDWRTIALIAMFARNSVQRTIRAAENLYRQFGPIVRDALRIGWSPTEEHLRQVVGDRSRRGGHTLDDVRTFLEILQWSPFMEDRLLESKDYTRRFRDKIALEWLPLGLSTAKVSFTVSLLGRDAACLDARIVNHMFGVYRHADAGRESEADAAELSASAAMQKWNKRSDARGARGLTPDAVQTYRSYEDKLRRTPHYDPKWPMPLARAQWMLWERLGERPESAEHGSLWEVIGPLIDDASNR